MKKLLFPALLSFSSIILVCPDKRDLPNAKELKIA